MASVSGRGLPRRRPRCSYRSSDKAARRAKDAHSLQAVVADYLAAKSETVRPRTYAEIVRYLTRGRRRVSRARADECMLPSAVAPLCDVAVAEEQMVRSDAAGSDAARRT